MYIFLSYGNIKLPYVIIMSYGEIVQYYLAIIMSYGDITIFTTLCHMVT